MSTFANQNDDEASVADLLAAARLLPASQQRKLLARLQQELADRSAISGERTAGLHAGTWSTAADFDAPLDEGFWLGTDS